MKVLNNLSHIFPFFLLIFLNATYNDGLEIQDSADVKFGKYLYTKMLEYNQWLREKQLDPSPPIDTSFALEKREFGRVHLDCEISKHFITGLSQRSTDLVVMPESQFENHLFGTGYELKQMVELTGIFNCSGNMSYIYYEELKEDLPFTGQGKFKASLREMTEFLYFSNVGLTPEYKFDYTHSWPDYAFFPEIKYVELKGDWDKEEINDKYINDVSGTFSELYRTFLLFERNHMNIPSGPLMERYLREIFDVDLRTIIDDEDLLPPPFEPTPSTTTTPRPTTPTTTTTTVATTPSTISTTTPDSSSGTSLLLNLWLFVSVAIVTAYF